MTAYGAFIVLLFILAAGVLTIVFAPFVNQTTEIVNTDIENGNLSTTYITWFNLIVGFCKALPVFALVGAACWAVVRALERRQGEQI